MPRKKKIEKGVLKLDGDLSIQRAAELKDTLMTFISENDSISVDHSEAEDFDLIYLQLLISAGKYAEENKKKFQIIKSNDVFNAAVQLSGFGNVL